MSDLPPYAPCRPTYSVLSKQGCSDLDAFLRAMDDLFLPTSEIGWAEVATSNWNPLPGNRNPVQLQTFQVAPGTQPIRAPAVLKVNTTNDDPTAGLPQWPPASWLPEVDRSSPSVIAYSDPLQVDNGMQPPYLRPTSISHSITELGDQCETRGRYQERPLRMPEPRNSFDYAYPPPIDRPSNPYWPGPAQEYARRHYPVVPARGAIGDNLQYDRERAAQRAYNGPNADPQRYYQARYQWPQKCPQPTQFVAQRNAMYSHPLSAAAMSEELA